MPIITTKPVQNPAGDYDRLGVQLAISPMYKANDVGASVAIRMVPYRENEDGSTERLDDQDRSVVYGDAFEAAQTDPDLAQAVTTIMTALQTFITAKGL